LFTLIDVLVVVAAVVVAKAGSFCKLIEFISILVSTSVPELKNLVPKKIIMIATAKITAIHSFFVSVCIYIKIS
jgi:hypothetical protein